MLRALRAPMNAHKKFNAVVGNAPKIWVGKMGTPASHFRHHHLLNGCAMLVPSPLRTVATEVGGVLIRAMVVGDGFGLAGFGHLGGQSDHFR